MRLEDTWYNLVHFKHTGPYCTPRYCGFPLNLPFLHETPKIMFFFSHPMAAPTPPSARLLHSLCKPFIMTAIHNTSPSAGFYFPYRPVTVSSSYRFASTLLCLSLTLSPPWPPSSQHIHSLPFVSGQSKQAASMGKEQGSLWEFDG